MHKRDGEDYFTATSREANASIPPSPKQALEVRTHQQTGPLIVVLATGRDSRRALDY